MKEKNNAKNLRGSNVKKCVELIKEFHDSVPEGADRSVDLKKVMAGRAVEQLVSFIAAWEYGGGEGEIMAGPFFAGLNTEDGPPCDIVPKEH